jgi:hypothetical protein
MPLKNCFEGNTKSLGTKTYKIEVLVCKECGCTIDEFGCSYGCKYDGIEHPPGQLLVNTYERTDKLIESKVR